jgi:hypothetical protein
MKIICWIKTFWRNWDNLNWYLGITMVSGCDFEEQEDGSLKCKNCGGISN